MKSNLIIKYLSLLKPLLNFDIYRFFNTFIVLYALYSLNKKIESMAITISDSVAAITVESLKKILTNFSKNIELHNKSLIEAHLEKLATFDEKMANNYSTFITKTSSNMDTMLLKMSSISPSPYVTMEQSSITSKLIITGCVVVAIIAIASYLMVPKVAVITTNELLKLQDIVTGVLKRIPASNNATGSIHVEGYPFYQITTKISSGIPDHMICDNRTNKSVSLDLFIQNLMEKILAKNKNLDVVADVIKVATDSGALDIGGLM